MSATFFTLTVLSGALGGGALLALAWLSRALRWEVVDDDALDDQIARSRPAGLSRFKVWLKPKPRMLTYRRDRLGRFRRHRR